MAPDTTNFEHVAERLSKRLIASLLHRLDELYAGGTLGKALILALLTAVVVGSGMLAVPCGRFSEANAGGASIPRGIDGPRDAPWWSFRHVLGPAFFSENYGAMPLALVIPLLVAVDGVSVFGTLVGLITTTLEERLDLLPRSDGRALPDALVARHAGRTRRPGRGARRGAVRRG